jgi:hypothetical protein
MLKRGRISASEDAVVVEGEFGTRPQPPDDLNDRQAEIWRQAVASEPADFFNTSALRNILSDYCRHRESAEGISEIISDFKSEWLKSAEGAKRYYGLLKMRDLEMRASLSCATKLRLTNQSRYTPQAASTATRNSAKIPRPWEE